MCRPLFLSVLLLGQVAFSAAPKAKSDQGRKYLEAAIKLYNAFEFERALAQLEKARKQSEGTEMDVTIALYEGTLQLELGRDEQAEAAFKTALSLDGNAALPTRGSPKVRELFDRLKAEMAKASPPPTNPPPPANPPPVVAAADPNPPPPVVTPPIVTARPRTSSPPGFWWAPAAGGVVLAVVGSVFLVQAKDRSDKLAGRTTADFDLMTAERFRSDGKTFQTLGFTTLSLGIACLAVSAILFLLVRS